MRGLGRQVDHGSPVGQGKKICYLFLPFSSSTGQPLKHLSRGNKSGLGLKILCVGNRLERAKEGMWVIDRWEASAVVQERNGGSLDWRDDSGDREPRVDPRQIWELLG